MNEPVPIWKNPKVTHAALALLAALMAAIGSYYGMPREAMPPAITPVEAKPTPTPIEVIAPKSAYQQRMEYCWRFEDHPDRVWHAKQLARHFLTLADKSPDPQYQTLKAVASLSTTEPIWKVWMLPVVWTLAIKERSCRIPVGDETPLNAVARQELQKFHRETAGYLDQLK